MYDLHYCDLHSFRESPSISDYRFEISATVDLSSSVMCRTRKNPLMKY